MDEASARSHPSKGSRHAQDALHATQSLLSMLAAGLFVLTFVVQPVRIPSQSMEPTLQVGDLLLMDKQTGGLGRLLPSATVRRGDVVVFHDPVGDPSKHLVKRVIGVPGDTIHLRGGIVYRNGQALKESYATYRRAAEDRYRDDFPDLHTMQPLVDPNWWIRLRSLLHNGEVTVPPGCYFVLGDNRNDSKDSRYWGFVPEDAIVGKPLLIYFSWRQAQEADADSRPTAKGWSAAGFARWDRTLRVVR